MRTTMTDGKVTIVEWTYEHVVYFYNKDKAKKESNKIYSEDLYSDEYSYFIDSKGKKHYEYEFENYIDE